MERYVVFTLIFLMTTSSAMAAVDVTFTPRLTLSGEYTSNFYRAPDNEVNEYTTSVSPGVTFGFRGRTGELILTYDMSYVTFSETEEESDWRHLGNLTGNWALSRRTSLYFIGLLIISEDPADDPEAAAGARGRNQYNRYTGDIGVRHQFGQEDSFGLGFAYTARTFEENYNEDPTESMPYFDFTKWFGESRYGMEIHLDYVMGHFEISDDLYSTRDHLRLMRRMNRQFNLFVQYEHTVTEYDGASEGYSVYSPSFGFTYAMQERTTINMALGYFIRDREESKDDDGVSLTGDITTSIPFRRGSFELTAASGYRQVSFDAENLGFNYHAEIDGVLDYGFTSNFRGDLFGGYRYDQYLDLDPERTDNAAFIGAGLTDRVLPWIVLRLEGQYRSVASTEEDRKYDESRVFLSVTFAPANPFHLN